MFIEDVSPTSLIVVEGHMLLALYRKIREVKPVNAPPDYDKLRDLENISYLLLNGAEELKL